MSARRSLLLHLMSVVLLCLPVSTSAVELVGNEIRFGYINPFSGWASALGKDNEIAVAVAVDEINARGGIGGIPLKIIKYDTESRQKQAISLMQRLAKRDKVLAVLGPYISSLSEVAFPVANRLGIVAVSSASVKPGITRRNRPWTFRNVMTSDRILEPAFLYWVKRHRIRTVSMAFDSADFPSKTEAIKVFPRLFERSGVLLLTAQSFQTGNLDLSAQAKAIKAAKPDGVVLPARHYESSNMAHELRRLGVTAPIFVGVGSTSPVFARLGKPHVERTVSAQAFWPDNPDPRVTSFVKRYRERSGGTLPPYYAANIYDNIFIMKEAIEKKDVTNDPSKLKEDRAKIRDWWRFLREYPGVAGLTTMTPSGNAEKQIFIMEIQDGKWRSVQDRPPR